MKKNGSYIHGQLEKPELMRLSIIIGAVQGRLQLNRLKVWAQIVPACISMVFRDGSQVLTAVSP